MADQITIVGNIASDPDLRTLADGRPLLKFRMATNHRRLDNDTKEWVDDAPSFYSISVFGSLAKNGGASLEKGQRVIVAGRLVVRSWTGDTGPHTDVQITADALGIDLLFGTAKYARGGTSAKRGQGERSTAADGWAIPVHDGDAAATAPADETSSDDLAPLEREDEEVVATPF
ncbi:single-stranded DNA-binding protein [Microbacterium gilvum]|uniref:Single-stranded DNA-binding protein n=1 Tax=Microbacterium gilvum TaxID=1336204 RepID=A0ABP8ZUW6_9MICO